MELKDFAVALRSLANLADGTDQQGTVAVTVQVPPGDVAIRPTGVQGTGKTRYWPEPHPDKGETFIGYETRCMGTQNPVTGQPFWPMGRWGAGMQANFPGASFAEILDRLTYGSDWMTQAELDQAAATAARDAGHGFSPGG